MNSEIMLGYQFLMSTLGSDSTLAGYAPGGVFRALAKPNAATPYVIIALQSPGNDSMTLNKVRVFTSPLFQVKAVGPASNTSAIVNAAQQIDTLLGGNQGLRNVAITGGYLYDVYRESGLEVDSLENGELWSNVGGLYRMELQATA